MEFSLFFKALKMYREIELYVYTISNTLMSRENSLLIAFLLDGYGSTEEVKPK